MPNYDLKTHKFPDYGLEYVLEWIQLEPEKIHIFMYPANLEAAEELVKQNFLNKELNSEGLMGFKLNV